MGLFMVIALIFGIFTRKTDFEFSIIFSYGFGLVIPFTVGLILLAGAVAALGGLIGVKIRKLRENMKS
ncbi:MAG: hypothetical protein KKF16_10220 [Euryarchaeota archaeon]|nr:hypothetical protein [Euryarchaeota archaeon]MBV1728909.1 hypothetical protein [Methanobacterium sp.]MBU4547199.1 hypothetical protein [Euryarchaeota archaeon]MBU4607548.1 hypothetical protein [Euryarchaeota archaeon]MBV1754355.1 hypothetical protein [Methanobacterium sp.]